MENTTQQTTQDLDARIAELEEDFRIKQEAVSRMPEKPPESANEKKEKELKRLKEEAGKKLEEAKKEKARILLMQAKQKKRDINVEIGKLRFPDSVSDDHARRSVGEQQVQSALILLSKSESHEVIISAMQNAVNVNRIDFASTLLDKILATAPAGILDISDTTEFDLPTTKPNDYRERGMREFCLKLIEIYDSLGNKEQLEQLNKELKKVLAIEARLKNVIDPIQPIASVKTKAGTKVKADELPSSRPNVYNPGDKDGSVEFEPLESNAIS
jgi:hypothetical protein